MAVRWGIRVTIRRPSGLYAVPSSFILATEIDRSLLVGFTYVGISRCAVANRRHCHSPPHIHPRRKLTRGCETSRRPPSNLERKRSRTRSRKGAKEFLMAVICCLWIKSFPRKLLCRSQALPHQTERPSARKQTPSTDSVRA